MGFHKNTIETSRIILELVLRIYFGLNILVSWFTKPCSFISNIHRNMHGNRFQTSGSSSTIVGSENALSSVRSGMKDMERQKVR